MPLQIHPETERKLASLPLALHAEFPDISDEMVRIEVDTITRDMLASARIEDFIPVLVHRFARDHPRERLTHGQVATASWPVEGPG
jgi:hypothetical protein